MNTTTKFAAPAIMFAAMLLAGCQEEDRQGMVGTLERDRIALAFESSEPIVAIHVRDGTRVKAGTLLVEQDDERARLAVSRLESERDLAAARLAELERGPREESIREAHALLESAQAETTNAQAELKRTQDIFEKGLSNRSELDRAATRYATAQAQETARRESLEALLHGTTLEELQQAAATVQVAEMAVAEARLALERTRLYAPVDGLLDKVLARLGERPQPGQAVVIMLDSARAYARVYVPENLKSQITPGTSIQVAIDGENQPFDGSVRWISSDASFTPYFALTEHDRSHLSYVAEIELPGAGDLPTGVPLVARAPGSAPGEE